MKHSHTKWSSIPLTEVDIESSEVSYDLHCITIEYNLITASGYRYYYTSDLFERNEAPPKMKPVIIDEQELGMMQKYIQDEFKVKAISLDVFVKCFENLTEICKTFPEKKLYLRTFNLSKFGIYQQCFVTEVLELIEILLERQGASVEPLKKILPSWQEYWKGEDPCFYAMSLDEVHKILHHFDIDKRLITLVPDICFVDQCQYKSCVESGYSAVVFPGPDGKEVMHVDQAVFVLFQAVVVEVDWNEKDADEQRKRDTREFKEKVIEVMRSCYRRREGNYLTKKHVLHLVAELREHPEYQRRQSLPMTPLLELLYCEFDDQIKVSYIVERCHQFGFGDLIDKATSSVPRDELFSFYMARLIMMTIWLEDFFKDDYADVKTRVLEVLSTKMKFINDGRLRYLIQRNLFDMEVNIAHENGKQCFFPIAKFTHPWYTKKVVDDFYSNENVVRSWKWQYTKPSELEVTSEIIEGVKKGAVSEYLKNAKKMKKRNELAKEVVRKVMYEMLSHKREKNMKKLEEESSDELDDIIEQAQLVERVRKQETVLRNIDGCRKRGPNQWRNCRQLRKIVQNALPNFMLSCIDALDE